MLRKRGKYWHVQLKVNGRPWNRSTGETDLARARIAEKRILIEAQLRREQPPESLSFDQAVIRELTRLEHDVSRMAAQRGEYCFRAFQVWLGKDVPLTTITSELIEKFQRQRLIKASRSTVDKEICAIVRLMKLNGFAVDRPKAKPGRVTEQRAFSQDELKLFFNHCEEDQRTLFLTMLATGARPAELLPSDRSGHVALLKSELDPEAGTILIRGAKARPGCKTKTRVVDVSEDLMDRLTELTQRIPGQHVFLKFTNLCRVFNRILAAAGIDKLNPLGRKLTAHSFRHTYATRMAQSIGGNPFMLKQILGHSQISTTDRYCHLAGSSPKVDVVEFLEGPQEMDVKNGCQEKKKAVG